MSPKIPKPLSTLLLALLILVGPRLLGAQTELSYPYPTVQTSEGMSKLAWYWQHRHDDDKVVLCLRGRVVDFTPEEIALGAPPGKHAVVDKFDRLTIQEAHDRKCQGPDALGMLVNVDPPESGHIGPVEAMQAQLDMLPMFCDRTGLVMFGLVHDVALTPQGNGDVILAPRVLFMARMGGWRKFCPGLPQT